jgi:two-component system, LytTR family, sensor kinase
MLSKTKLYWVLQLIYWGAYIGFNTFSSLFLAETIGNIPLGSAINFVVIIAGTHIYKLSIRQYHFDTLSYKYMFIYPTLTCALLTFLITLSTFLTYPIELIFPSKQAYSFAFFLILYAGIFRVIASWFVLYHGYKFAIQAMNNSEAKANAEMLLKIAELENLKNHLNPHFLFNTLNTIKSLTLTNSSLAREVTTKLSDLFRKLLINKQLSVILLEEELSFISDYLSLEKIRFEDRLTYQFNIQPSLRNTKVPTMALQLLVEDAVKNSISNQKTGGKITIFAHQKGNFIHLGVKYSGSYQPLNDERDRLESLMKRVHHTFSEKNRLSIDSQEDSTIISLLILV